MEVLVVISSILLAITVPWVIILKVDVESLELKNEKLEDEVRKLKERDSKIDRMETKLKTMEHEIVSLRGLLLANENRSRNFSNSTDTTNFEKIADKLDSMHTTLRLIYFDVGKICETTEKSIPANCFEPIEDRKIEL